MQTRTGQNPEIIDRDRPGPDRRPPAPETSRAESMFQRRWSVLALTILTTAGAMAVSVAITSGTYFLIDPSHMAAASILALVCPFVIAPPICFYWFSMIRRHQRTQRELVLTNRELAQALSQVKELTGLLPICASCKRIRDDQGYWTRLETYLTENSRAEFTHSICPDCRRKLYPELAAVSDARDKSVK
jgi:hypothetical protein